MASVSRPTMQTVLFAAFVVVYCAGLVYAAPLRPLWLDEIIQLIGTRSMPTGDLMHYVTRDPGQAPLAYLLQSGLIHLFGYSLLTARALSIVASVGACIGIAYTGRFLGLSFWSLPSLVFASLPLQVRYALEARPYELALFFAVLSTVLILRLFRSGTPVTAIAYAATISLGVLTQPYFAFVPLAHLLWAALRLGLGNANTRYVALAFSIMVAVYMPWFFETRSVLIKRDHPIDIGPRTILVVFKELLGGGYLLSLLILLLVVFALWNQPALKGTRLFWAMLAFVPIAGPVLADFVFRYLIANRQTMYSLPSLSVVAASAFQRVGRVPVVVGTGLFLLTLGIDARWFTKPHENWETAARILMDHTKGSGTDTCVALAPRNSLRFYTFFEPEISRHLCMARDLEEYKTVLLGVSPYGEDAEYKELTSALLADNKREQYVLSDGLPKIFRFEQRHHAVAGR